jgi:hypothetical protein
MPVKSAWRWRFVTSLVLTLACAGAEAREDQVDCADVQLTFASDGYSRICYAGAHELLSDSGELVSESYEEIIAYGTAPQLRLSVHRAGAGSTFTPLSVQAYVEARGWFTKTKDWEPEREMEGYRVQLLQGTWPGMGGFMHCAGLLHQESADATARGFDRMIGGFFCFSAGGDHLIAHLKPFLASIRY